MIRDHGSESHIIANVTEIDVHNCADEWTHSRAVAIVRRLAIMERRFEWLLSTAQVREVSFAVFQAISDIWDLEPHTIMTECRHALVTVIDARLADFDEGGWDEAKVAEERERLRANRAIIATLDELQSMCVVEALQHRVVAQISALEAYQRMLGRGTSEGQEATRLRAQLELREQERLGSDDRRGSCRAGLHLRAFGIASKCHFG